MRRIVRQNELCVLLGVHRSTLHRWMAAGDLPRPKKLGNQCVGWPEDVLEQWLATRPDAGTTPKEKQ